MSGPWFLETVVIPDALHSARDDGAIPAYDTGEKSGRCDASLPAQVPDHARKDTVIPGSTSMTLPTWEAKDAG